MTRNKLSKDDFSQSICVLQIPLSCPLEVRRKFGLAICPNFFSEKWSGMPVVLQVPKLENTTGFEAQKSEQFGFSTISSCKKKNVAKLISITKIQRLTSKSSLTSLMSAINLEVPSANQRKHLGGTIMKFFPLTERLHDTIEFKASFCWSFGLQSYESHEYVQSFCDTVDGRNPKQPPGMVVNPMNNGFIHHPWWCRILSINRFSPLVVDFPPSLAGLSPDCCASARLRLASATWSAFTYRKNPGKKKNEEK